jgi:hypothetical protein
VYEKKEFFEFMGMFRWDMLTRNTFDHVSYQSFKVRHADWDLKVVNFFPEIANCDEIASVENYIHTNLGEANMRELFICTYVPY